MNGTTQNRLPTLIPEPRHGNDLNDLANDLDKIIEPVRLDIVNAHGLRVRIIVDDPVGPRAQPVDKPDLEQLREVERNAIEAASTETVPVAQLAMKAGYQPGSYFSAAVTRLTRLGFLVRKNGGIRLP